MPETLSPAQWTPRIRMALVALLLAWGGLTLLAGTTGALATADGTPLRPIVLTAIVPVALFLAAYAASGRLRAFVRGQSFEALTAIQQWRVVGFTFLALYAVDELPALFAFPAGLGDVAVGLTAFFVLARLAREPDFARSRRFVAFHVMGLLDFAVAVATAGLTAGAFPSLIPGSVTSAPMEVWPLILFPAFIVPVFIILHLAVFLKLRAETVAAAEYDQSRGHMLCT